MTERSARRTLAAVLRAFPYHNAFHQPMRPSASTSDAFKEKSLNTVNDAVKVFQENCTELAIAALVKHKGDGADSVLSVPDKRERQNTDLSAI